MPQQAKRVRRTTNPGKARILEALLQALMSKRKGSRTTDEGVGSLRQGRLDTLQS